ncbi:MAG: VCBS repeat-containing protein, partial [Acidobacteria bacterium]|nr:VCBS repeat-containing protein [Acidobacteriota bacterium]
MPKSARLFWALSVLVGLLLAAMPMAARRAGASAAQQGGNAFWETVEPAAREAHGNAAAAQPARVFRLREQVMREALQQAGPERAGRSEQPAAVIALPLPDGSFARFSVVEAPVLSAELAAQYPELKSYRGQGVDNPGLAVWCSWTPLGLRAWVRDGADTLRIQPLTDAPTSADSFPLDYVSLVEGVEAEQAQNAVCFAQFKQMAFAQAKRAAPADAATFSVGPTLRTYRLAIATTQEYAVAYGGTGSPTVIEGNIYATLQNWLAPVNLIYSSELAIQFTLVSNGDLIFRNDEPDQFTNGTVNLMADEVRALFKNKLSEGSYDLGMVLGTGSGGTAYIGVVCENAADSNGPYKGGAALLVNGAVGNANSVRLIAHEMGHQFGAMHTQNADCAGAGRFGDSAVEPGNGVSLMSNPGACSGHEIVTARGDFFHATSFAQINQFLGSFVSTNCATTSTIMNGGVANSAPMFTFKTPNYTTPKGTPFTLTAMASDSNSGDTVTYAWEQVDAGGADFFNGPYTDAGDLANNTNTTRPLFRPFLPMTNITTRTFPSLTYILNNANVPPDTVSVFKTAESLPQVARTLNFMVTARDGHGGVNNDTVQLTVDGNSGPFQFESFTGNWPVGTGRVVRWQANNTNVAPILCSKVKISLSLDGGNTFPHVLMAETNNDGIEGITLPTIIHTSNTDPARLKIEAMSNIFFDISDSDFNVVSNNNCVPLINKSQAQFTRAGGNDTVMVTAASGCSWVVADKPSWITITSVGSGTGNDTVSYTVTANTGAVRKATFTIAGQFFSVLQQAAFSKADFDGDGKADLSVFRPAAVAPTPNWYVLNSSNGVVATQQWGAGYAPYFDTIVPGDYDGDGKADHAIWRGADSLWYIRPSATPNSPIVQLWGANYAPYFDIPTPGDYDGDGKTDVAVFRRSGTWFVKRSSDGMSLI